MEILRELLGIGVKPEHLNLWQTSLRGLVIFVGALILIRVGAKRSLGRKTAFDTILMFILGSMLARAINGSSPLISTLAAGFVLVMFHRLMAMLAFRFHRFGTLVKGSDDLIIADGQTQKEAMRKHCLTEGDLREDLRLRSVGNVSDVKEARLERSGDLSVLKKS